MADDAMTFISLFSCIGGIDLGLERAGMKCVAQVEIDDYFQRVLLKHWPNVPKFKDVRDVGKNNLPTAKLIAGGFPCQPHSLAGKRKASDDDRDLWPEFARIVREIEPEWVLAENVPGLLSSENGRFFGEVLADLASSGYGVEWQSIPAAAFGAPHIRDRVFIIAHHESIGKGSISIFPRGSQQKSSDLNGQNVSNLASWGQQGSIPHYSENSGTEESCWNQQTNRLAGFCQTLSDANSQRCEQLNDARFACESGIVGRESDAGNIRNPNPVGLNRDIVGGNDIFLKNASWWSDEPQVGRVANGVSRRVDRLRGLGNAVVPQVAEYIGKLIMEANYGR